MSERLVIFYTTGLVVLIELLCHRSNLGFNTTLSQKILNIPLLYTLQVCIRCLQYFTSYYVVILWVFYSNCALYAHAKTLTLPRLTFLAELLTILKKKENRTIKHFLRYYFSILQTQKGRMFNYMHDFSMDSRLTWYITTRILRKRKKKADWPSNVLW